MKICVAQIKPVKGDIQSNIENHKRLIEAAVTYGSDVIVFPELSLTGYEPTLAEKLAISPNDLLLDDFQNISNTKKVTIGVGVPTKNDNGICISMILFQPNKPRQIYSKKYIHRDEEEYFVSGDNFTNLTINNTQIAFAICYEISIDEHTENAFGSGAEIYIASVAKFKSGIDKALERLSGFAKKYSATVLMSNCIGQADGEECAGKSSIWNSEGKLLAQLDDSNEGILMIDTSLQKIISSLKGLS